jgi:hypothetical protein
VEQRLQPGDLVTFNNRRVLHARNSFDLNGGIRHLKVSINAGTCILMMLKNKMLKNFLCLLASDFRNIHEKLRKIVFYHVFARVFSSSFKCEGSLFV